MNSLESNQISSGAQNSTLENELLRRCACAIYNKIVELSTPHSLNTCLIMPNIRRMSQRR